MRMEVVPSIWMLRDLDCGCVVQLDFQHSEWAKLVFLLSCGLLTMELYIKSIKISDVRCDAVHWQSTEYFALPYSSRSCDGGPSALRRPHPFVHAPKISQRKIQIGLLFTLCCTLAFPFIADLDILLFECKRKSLQLISATMSETNIQKPPSEANWRDNKSY